VGVGGEDKMRGESGETECTCSGASFSSVAPPTGSVAFYEHERNTHLSCKQRSHCSLYVLRRGCP